MIYIDIIATDTEDSLDFIEGKKDHKWVGFHDGVSKPKIGLWQLWNIKKFIEKAYEKLEAGRSEAIIKGVEEGDFTEVQDIAESNGGKLGEQGGNPVDGIREPKAGVESD